MLGADGLKKSTEIAILNANYIKQRLQGAFETLYSGERGRAAHEMIIDCRPESESKAEMDRFCDAMISIRKEIDSATKEEVNNVLKNAPHTLTMVTGDEWYFPYTRETAAFPLDYVRDSKFWPSVRRVDDAYGDRNLICTCAPIEAYMEV